MTFSKEKKQRAAVYGIILFVYIFLTVIEIILVRRFVGRKIDYDVFLYCTIEVSACYLVIAAIYSLELIFKFTFPIVLECAAPVFFFLALGLGGGVRFYEFVTYWDVVLHTSSGCMFAFLGYISARLIVGDRLEGARKALIYSLFAVLITMGEGYLWELFEYLLDTITPIFNSQSWKEGIITALEDGTYIIGSFRGSAITDTMGDMLANLIGSLVTISVVTPLLVKRPTVYRVFDMGRTKAKKPPMPEVCDEGDEGEAK